MPNNEFEFKSEAPLSSESQTAEALDSIYEGLNRIPSSALSLFFRYRFRDLIQKRNYATVLLEACEICHAEVLNILFKHKEALGMSFSEQELNEAYALVLTSNKAGITEAAKRYILSLLDKQRGESPIRLTDMTANPKASSTALPTTEAQFKLQPAVGLSSYGVHFTSPLALGSGFILPPTLNQLLEEFNQIEMPGEWDLHNWIGFKEKMQLLMISRAYNKALATACHYQQLETVKLLLKYKMALGMQFDDEVLSDCLAMDYFLPEAKAIASLVKGLMAHKRASTPPLPQTEAELESQASPSFSNLHLASPLEPGYVFILPPTEAEFKSQPARPSSSSVIAEVSVRQENSALLTSSFFSNLKAQRLDLLLNELKQALSSLSIVDREEINKLILQEKYDMVLLSACKHRLVDVLRILFKYKDSLNMNIDKNKLEEALNSVLLSEVSNDAIIAVLLEEQTKLSDEMQPH